MSHAVPRLLAKGREYLDLHDLSAGAAKFAVPSGARIGGMNPRMAWEG